MQILQTTSFSKIAKKLPTNKKYELDNAIQQILNNPLIGEAKLGDLFDVRVLKFRMQNQLILVAYEYDEPESSIILLALASHENFYRDLKSK